MEEEEWEISIRVVWVSIATYLVFLMQLGFAFLEAGSIRLKNLQSILFKNCFDICTDSLVWWLVGYSIAFGEDYNSFLGTTGWATYDFDDDYADYLLFLFQWAFAGTSATIVSGCVAERMPIWGYISFSMFSIAWIYPVIVHWAWGGGWLHQLGFKDFAGSGVVHVTGGFAGLVATIMMGPRLERFNPAKSDEFRPNNTPFCVLGALLLWFSWYGFNCGSTYGASGENILKIPLVGMNTSLSAVSGAVTVMGMHFLYYKETKDKYSTTRLCNGALAGLVAVTCSCNMIRPYAAVIVGVLAGITYSSSSALLIKLKIDDPIDASPIHCACGILGVIYDGFCDVETGIVYGGGWRQLGVQLLGLLAILGWVVLFEVPFMQFLRMLGLLRVSPEVEHQGMDTQILGGLAYNYTYDQVLNRHKINVSDDILQNTQRKKKVVT